MMPYHCAIQSPNSMRRGKFGIIVWLENIHKISVLLLDLPTFTTTVKSMSKHSASI